MGCNVKELAFAALCELFVCERRPPSDDLPDDSSASKDAKREDKKRRERKNARHRQLKAAIKAKLSVAYAAAGTPAGQQMDLKSVLEEAVVAAGVALARRVPPDVDAWAPSPAHVRATLLALARSFVGHRTSLRLPGLSRYEEASWGRQRRVRRGGA